MAAGAEVPRLAGEGEEALVAAVRALQSSEPSREVAAAVELADDGDGVLAEGTMDGAVAGFVACLEVGPTTMDELPKRRSAGTARALDGGHKNCLLEQFYISESTEMVG